jgi:spermidine synthase
VKDATQNGASAEGWISGGEFALRYTIVKSPVCAVPYVHMDDATRPNLLTLLAIVSLSAGMLIFELALTRLFALVQFYHFAFMAISLALLGGGAAGSALTTWPRLGRFPGRWSAGFAAGTLASLFILRQVPFDSYGIAWDTRQIVYLVLTFGGATLPFLCSGLVVSGLLAADTDRANQVYGANLIGSALGALGVLPLLAWLGGESTLLISAVLGLLAALMFALLRDRGRLQRGLSLVGALAGVVTLSGLAILRPTWITVDLSPYKSLVQVLQTPDARHTVSTWSASARIDIVESGSIHLLPGLSQNALLMQPPLQAGLTRDGDNLTPLTALPSEDELTGALADNVPLAVLSHLVSEPGTVLILEPGGGWDALMLLALWDEQSIPLESLTLVEQEPLVVDVLQNEYATYTFNLFNDPRLQVETVHPRTFVRRSDQSYTVIDVALSDSFHPVTSGAFTLSEDYRYTVEALYDYLDRLAPDGLLIITRWLQTPPTETLRILATLDAALRARGASQPGGHIAAFRSLRTMTFIVSNSPLTAEQLESVREFTAAHGYDLVWLPDIHPDEVNRYLRQPEPIYYKTFSSLLADPTGFIRTYEYDIRPPTDNRPFFFHFFRWQQTPAIVAALGHTWQPFGGSGYLVLVALLGLVSVLAVVLIVGPMLVQRTTSRLHHTSQEMRLRVLIYFAMLGLGFLFIEIPLAQRFILYVGHPVTALAVVLFSLLLFSGVGSLTAPRWRLGWALAALVGLAVLFPLLLDGVFTLSLGWSLIMRMAAAVVCLGPLGLLMGVPFARGLGLVEQVTPGLAPWAWSINSSVSVISAVLAVMVALSWGFSAVLWIGAGTYATALLALWPLAWRT